MYTSAPTSSVDFTLKQQKQCMSIIYLFMYMIAVLHHAQDYFNYTKAAREGNPAVDAGKPMTIRS